MHARSLNVGLRIFGYYMQKYKEDLNVMYARQQLLVMPKMNAVKLLQEFRGFFQFQLESTDKYVSWLLSDDVEIHRRTILKLRTNLLIAIGKDTHPSEKQTIGNKDPIHLFLLELNSKYNECTGECVADRKKISAFIELYPNVARELSDIFSSNELNATYNAWYVKFVDIAVVAEPGAG